MKKPIDISDPGEPEGTFVLQYRVRKDGRSSTWRCRLRLSEKDRLARQGRGSPYVTAALQATNKNTAMKQAIEWRRNWGPGNKKRAKLANIPTFAEAADRWLAHEEAKTEQARARGQRARSDDAIRRWRSCLERYLKPVFGDLPANGITLADGARWASWRQRYYVDGPGVLEIEHGVPYFRGGKEIRRPAQPTFTLDPSTISKDADAFVKALAFARSEYPHLEWSEPISLRRAATGLDQPEPRLRFTREQRSHIFEVASVRAHGVEGEHINDPPFNREVLYNLVRFLWCTGLRVAEVKRLKVSDILITPCAKDRTIYVPHEDVTSLGFEGPVDEFSQETAEDDPHAAEYDFQYRFRVDWVKHRSHRREVTPRLGIYNVMDRHLRQLERHFGKERRHPYTFTRKSVISMIAHLDGDLLLFPDAGGDEFKTMGKMHDRLLAAVRGDFPDGLRVIQGQKMSLSCWRHTYASELLEYFLERQKPNLVEYLAKNMGTSPAMIHRHYGHILARAAESELMV
jgi:integrase